MDKQGDCRHTLARTSHKEYRYRLKKGSSIAQAAVAAYPATTERQNRSSTAALLLRHKSA
jgi:hypothetical protein